MNRFAKIIEYQDFQIILQKVWEYDETLEQSIPGVRQTTVNNDDFEVNILLGFHEEQERDNFFDQYNDTDADNFIQEVLISLPNENIFVPERIIPKVPIEDTEKLNEGIE